MEDRLRLACGYEGLGFYMYDALGRRILRFSLAASKRREVPHFSGGVKGWLDGVAADRWESTRLLFVAPPMLSSSVAPCFFAATEQIA